MLQISEKLLSKLFRRTRICSCQKKTFIKYWLKGPAFPVECFLASTIHVGPKKCSPFGPAVWPAIGIREHIYECPVLLNIFWLKVLIISFVKYWLLSKPLSKLCWIQGPRGTPRNRIIKVDPGPRENTPRNRIIKVDPGTQEYT